MTAIQKAIATLQCALLKRFGKSKLDCGEQTVFISPSSVELTNDYGTIIASGPVKVATVLIRRCRKTGKIKR